MLKIQPNQFWLMNESPEGEKEEELKKFKEINHKI